MRDNEKTLRGLDQGKLKTQWRGLAGADIALFARSPHIEDQSPTPSNSRLQREKTSLMPDVSTLRNRQPNEGGGRSSVYTPPPPQRTFFIFLGVHLVSTFTEEGRDFGERDRQDRIAIATSYLIHSIRIIS